MVSIITYPYNLDFSQKLIIETYKMDWSPSPSSGVERIMLEREAPESGRATSIVRYAPNTFFKEHSHDLGEEIFVLSGEFVDEHGTYPQGTYLRHPPGSKHSPGSHKGCVLFVKLGHFDPADSERVRKNTTTETWYQGQGRLQVMPLHQFKTEGTALVKWPAGERFLPHRHWGGEEIFVLSGEFIDEHSRYPEGTWIRSPHLSSHHPFVEKETVILVKTGHLLSSIN
jgi:anti-sigma factor ChrR (cupin superfamily)